MNRPLSIIIFFALAFLAGFFLVWPNTQEFSSLGSRIKEKEVEVKNWDTHLANLRSLEIKLEEHKDQIAKIDAAIPDKLRLPLLYDLMQKRVAQSGLVLKSISIAPNAAKSSEEASSSLGVQKAEISLSLEGSYAAFKGFVLNTRKAPRILSIDSFTLTPPAKGETFGFEVQMSAYSY